MQRYVTVFDEQIPENAKLAIYGAGGRGRTLADLLAGERPDVAVHCFVDSVREDPDATPPVVRVDRLSALADEIDGVVMATAFNRDILSEHGDVLRRFPICFFDGVRLEGPGVRPEGAAGSVELDHRTLAGWDGLERGFEDEAATKAILHPLAPHTMVSYDGLMTLAELVRHLDRTGVPGALVECGSWRGGSSALMGAVHMESGEPVRALHVFDSFQGLPEPDGENDVLHESMLSEEERDRDFTGELRPIGSLVADRASNEQAIFDIVGYPRKLTKFHEGWFQDTVPGAGVGPIAILRLDGDLYDSYKVCLEHLYPLVSAGGVVIIDDWVLPGCRAAVQEYFAGRGGLPYLHRIDSIARYIIKGRGVPHG